MLKKIIRFSTVNKKEVEKFQKISDWWSSNG